MLYEVHSIATREQKVVVLQNFTITKTYHYRVNACLDYSDTLRQLGEYHLFDFEIGFSESHIGDVKRYLQNKVTATIPILVEVNGPVIIYSIYSVLCQFPVLV